MRANVAHLAVRAAQRAPEDVAVIDAAATVTYAQLARQAGGIARLARARGARAADRVAILLDRGSDLAAAIVAVHAMGGIGVVINDRLRLRQVQHVLGDAEPSLLVTTDTMLGRLGGALRDAPPRLDPREAEPAALEPAARDASDLAQIIYTSGSTGLPKGVMFTHGAIGAGVAIVTRYLGLRADDRIAGLPSLSAVYGLNQMLCSLHAGAALILDLPPFPAEVVASLIRHQATVAAAVPPLWVQLLEVPAFRVPIGSLRQLQNAGGHLPVDVVRRLRAAQPQADLILQYGMTETWRGTWLPPHLVDERPGCMGQAVPEAELLVVRPDGSLCAPDEAGELVHAGPTLAEGYWRSPEATRAVFREHPLRPGVRAVFSADIVRRDAAGFFTYVSRNDRVIKTMGYRVGPDEVADVLRASGLVRDVVVTGEDDAARGQRIVAWVVLEPGGTVAALTRHARAGLPPYMQPARIEARDTLPRLASGKYDVPALLAETR